MNILNLQKLLSELLNLNDNLVYVIDRNEDYGKDILAPSLLQESIVKLFNADVSTLDYTTLKQFTADTRVAVEKLIND